MEKIPQKTLASTQNVEYIKGVGGNDNPAERRKWVSKFTIKVARVIAGLTQEELAEKMGVSRSSVTNWERGLQSMTGRNLQVFCEVTGMKAEDIILPFESTKEG